MINTKTFTSSVVPPAEGCCAMTDRFKRLNRSRSEKLMKSQERKCPKIGSKADCPQSGERGRKTKTRKRLVDNLSTVCHNFFSDSSPAYLSDPLTVYTPSRQLRSSADTRSLRIPHVKTQTFGRRSFSYSAPKQWNSLPSDNRHIQSSHAFKTALKTHLYKQYYNN